MLAGAVAAVAGAVAAVALSPENTPKQREMFIFILSNALRCLDTMLLMVILMLEIFM